MKRNTDRDKAIFGAVALGLVVLAVLGVLWFQNSTKSVQSCTVTGKDMTIHPGTAATKDSSGTQAKTIYQVSTEQCGVLRVEDNALQGIWNSADLYAALVPGQTYRVTTVGVRLPIFSVFPTVTKVEK